MFSRTKKFFVQIQWTPRTIAAVVVLVLVPGGMFIAPWLIGSRRKTASSGVVGKALRDPE